MKTSLLYTHPTFKPNHIITSNVPRKLFRLYSEKEAIIEQQGNKFRSQNKIIVGHQEQILYLKQPVDKLRRQICGQKSEKHIPEAPQQRWLVFEGLDLLPEEKQLASSIADEIKAYKENRTQVRKDAKPAHRPFPENLERVMNAITSEKVIGY